MSGPRSTRTPRGHVARSIAEGKRPFLTATVAAATIPDLDALSRARGLSRGRMIDSLVAAAIEREREGEGSSR